MRRILLSLPFLLLTLSPAANAQTVSVPNHFTNGSAADANQVNANFDALESAVNSHDTRITAAQSAVNGINCATAAEVVCNPASVSCPACDTLDSFNQGAASVDITADNQASYDDGVASVDITADNEAVCTSAGGTWNCDQSCTCFPATSYNCFIGGFCAQAALDLSPWPAGYTNVYEGHTQSTAPALGAACNTEPGASLWDEGWCLASSSCIPHLPPLDTLFLPRVVCASN